MGDWIKLAKLLGVLVYVTGSVGCVVSRNFDDRKRFAVWLAGPGFLATWGFGVALTQFNAVPLFALWILGAMVCSIVSFNGVLYLSAKEGRGGPISTSVVVVPLLIAVSLMVLRPA